MLLFRARLLSTFAARADKELALLQAALEEALEDADVDDSDVDLKDGVLKLSIGSNHYVLNKQTPNEQIWWSSPLSGPRRYALRDDVWKW